jgi:hypothetical protein
VGLSGTANALTCSEITSMYKVRVPTEIIVQAIDDDADTYRLTSQDVACLKAAGLPREVIAAAERAPADALERAAPPVAGAPAALPSAAPPPYVTPVSAPEAVAAQPTVPVTRPSGVSWVTLDGSSPPLPVWVSLDARGKAGK